MPPTSGCQFSVSRNPLLFLSSVSEREKRKAWERKSEIRKGEEMLGGGEGGEGACGKNKDATAAVYRHDIHHL